MATKRKYEAGSVLHCVKCVKPMYTLTADRFTGEEMMAKDFKGVGNHLDPKPGDPIKCVECGHTHDFRELTEWRGPRGWLS